MRVPKDVAKIVLFVQLHMAIQVWEGNSMELLCAETEITKVCFGAVGENMVENFEGKLGVHCQFG